MMFARRSGAQPTPTERRALYSAFLISYAVLLLSLHTGPSGDPLFVSLNIPAAISSPVQIALAIAFLACSVSDYPGLLRQVTFRRMVPSLTLFSTQCIWFLVPTLLSLLEHFQIPRSRYGPGVLAIMHSAQYLWITSYYAKREAATTPNRSWRPLSYFAILVVGGIALFVPGPWISSLIFHFDLGQHLGPGEHSPLHPGWSDLEIARRSHRCIVGKFSCTDCGRRDGGWQSDDEGITWTGRTEPGRSRSARRGRRASAHLGLYRPSALLFRHAQYESGRPQAAASLAPYDTPVEVRLARKALEDGDLHESVAAWQYAIKANTTNPAGGCWSLRYLTQEKRFDEAYQLTATWLQLAPRDAALLVNHGILAQQFGHTEEAERTGRRTRTRSVAG